MGYINMANHISHHHQPWLFLCGAFGIGFITAGRFRDAGMGRQPAFGLALLGGPELLVQWIN